MKTPSPTIVPPKLFRRPSFKTNVRLDSVVLDSFKRSPLYASLADPRLIIRSLFVPVSIQERENSCPKASMVFLPRVNNSTAEPSSDI